MTRITSASLDTVDAAYIAQALFAAITGEGKRFSLSNPEGELDSMGHAFSVAVRAAEAITAHVPSAWFEEHGGVWAYERDWSALAQMLLGVSGADVPAAVRLWLQREGVLS